MKVYWGLCKYDSNLETKFDGLDGIVRWSVQTKTKSLGWEGVQWCARMSEPLLNLGNGDYQNPTTWTCTDIFRAGVQLLSLETKYNRFQQQWMITMEIAYQESCSYKRPLVSYRIRSLTIFSWKKFLFISTNPCVSYLSSERRQDSVWYFPSQAEPLCKSTRVTINN